MYGGGKRREHGPANTEPPSWYSAPRWHWSERSRDGNAWMRDDAWRPRPAQGEAMPPQLVARGIPAGIGFVAKPTKASQLPMSGLVMLVLRAGWVGSLMSSGCRRARRRASP